MSTRPSNGWLFGAFPDLLFGAGLLYLIVLCAVTFAGSATGGVVPAAAIPILILIFSGGHYGGTLLRVFEHEEERRTYRIFTLHATVLMILLLLGALYSPTAGSVLISIYITWSPWHYTGQNYGIALMLMRRRGAVISRAAKNWVYASFVLSFLSVFLNFHFEGGIGQGDPLGYSANASSGFQFVSLGLPGIVRSTLMPLVGIAYVISLVSGATLLIRANGVKAVAPAGLVILIQAAWFSIPHFAYTLEFDSNIPALTLTGSGNFEDYFVWVALGHAIQYLWITSYYAKRDARWPGFTRYFAKAFVFGNAVWAAPLILLGPDTLGRPDYDGGLALCVAAAVNLHHFIVDGAIWKLRNPKVAAVLLRNVETVAQDASAFTRSRLVKRVCWGAGTFFALMAIVPSIELYKRFPDAIKRGDYDTAEAILDRAALYGRDSARYRTSLANELVRTQSPLPALRNYWRSLKLQPQPDGYLQVGILNAKLHGTESGLHAWETGVEIFPENAALNKQLGMTLAELWRYAAALPYLEHAAELDPDDETTANALRKALEYSTKTN